VEKLENFQSTEEIAESVSSYRLLQVLHLQFMTLFTPVVLPTIYQYSLIAILLVAYCLIRLHDKISYLNLLILICILNSLLILMSAALRMGSSMYVDSVSFIQAFKPGTGDVKNQNLDEYTLTWRRQIPKSLTPLKITIGRITFMKKSTSMALFSFIFYITMRLVIRL
jgi:hypothetical protein